MERLIYLLVIFSVLLLQQGCREIPDTIWYFGDREYRLDADEIDFRKVTPSSDTLFVVVSGYLGNTDCHYFSRYEIVSRDSFSVMVRLYGKQRRMNLCQELEKRFVAICKISPIYRGEFVFVVEQSDGNRLYKSVII